MLCWLFSQVFFSVAHHSHHASRAGRRHFPSGAQVLRKDHGPAVANREQLAAAAVPQQAVDTPAVVSLVVEARSHCPPSAAAATAAAAASAGFGLGCLMARGRRGEVVGRRMTRSHDPRGCK